MVAVVPWPLGGGAGVCVSVGDPCNITPKWKGSKMEQVRFYTAWWVLHAALRAQ